MQIYVYILITGHKSLLFNSILPTTFFQWIKELSYNVRLASALRYEQINFSISLLMLLHIGLAVLTQHVKEFPSKTFQVYTDTNYAIGVFN